MRSFDIRPRQNPRPAQPIKLEAPPRQRRSWPKILLVLVLLAGFGIGIFGFLILPEAQLSVTARTEPVTRDLEVQVAASQSAVDAAALAVPGRVIEDEASGSKKVSATGSKNIGAKASGFVKIYNFSKNTLILRSQTTTLTAGNGRAYVLAQDVSGIRPTAVIGLADQEIDETSLIAPVPVIATGPGEEYNLAKGTRLEIRNEAFGSNPKTLYALVADDGVTGETTKSVKVVTDADIVAGQKALSAELLETARARLAEKQSDVKLLDGAFTTEVSGQASSATTGHELAEFEVTQKLKVRALVFAEGDVRQVILSRVKRLLAESKVLKDEQGDRLECQWRSADLAAGMGMLSCHYEGEIVYRVDEGLLVSRVKGKSVDEIRELLLSRPEVADLEVKLLPFWAKSAPQYSKRITIEIK